ncbi:hypothetical protein J2Z40_001163 [Cytobacillus eiseniae]|uniref:Membrane protein YszA n=1 Tax=Cytobacillus eiseniae TaxID=762947 RepID=A0ABS4RCJ0_9BACI|nr:hypothetical protein [Cytobacillus eiseniae]MBP2240606.1 hypothetical protein [Cytobacillus eiseniae]
MKRKYSPYTLPPWLRKVRGACAQFIIPICVFQGIRTILFPFTLDVLLLTLLILLAVALHLNVI